ncbi:hypothetical protein [Arthrobacter sp. YC-RL1]|uniref:hypothetical protein n=1 Tax=Arthrobacter sp. YC-RL1 TaxID=1652545 RepID=UPI00128E204E|nr:hypothetical protein [Arthrobacter sp. YC-RL1]
MRAFRRFLICLATLLTLLGAAGSVIMFLQPWRSCPEIDDSSAGCPATESDLALLGLAVAANADRARPLDRRRSPVPEDHR